MRLGVDYSFSRPSGKIIRGAGFDFACRYLSNGSTKDITADEVADFKANGIDLVLVFESTASRILEGLAAGVNDAKQALKQAKSVGFPENQAAIYFACDVDVNPSNFDAVAAYLQGCARVLAANRVGLYGEYEIVKEMFDRGMIAYGWQTYAWSGKKWDERAQLRQVKNGVTLNGAVDLDEAHAEDFGQWKLQTPVEQEDMGRIEDLIKDKEQMQVWINERDTTISNQAATIKTQDASLKADIIEIGNLNDKIRSLHTDEDMAAEFQRGHAEGVDSVPVGPQTASELFVAFISKLLGK